VAHISCSLLTVFHSSPEMAEACGTCHSCEERAFSVSLCNMRAVSCRFVSTTLERAGAPRLTIPFHFDCAMIGGRLAVRCMLISREQPASNDSISSARAPMASTLTVYPPTLAKGDRHCRRPRTPEGLSGDGEVRSRMFCGDRRRVQRLRFQGPDLALSRLPATRSRFRPGLLRTPTSHARPSI
jgi:hypothetical protein